ncbi:MAG: hypothetical protein IKT59_08110 [Bacteroidales bacterium]|nr:hypothetical protein [Bacteroidales bacterium]
MNRLFAFALLFAILMLSVSCNCKDNGYDLDDLPEIEGFDHPITETEDEYSVTFQYKEGVTVLDESRLEYLVKVEADTILYFSSGIPTEIYPKEGDVVTARVSDKTPYGLGNKVVSVVDIDGMTKVITTHADLDEIFEELTWEYNGTLTDSLLEGYTDEDGNFIKPSYVWYNEDTGEYHSEATRGTIGGRKLVSWPFKFNEDKPFKIPKIEGSVYVGAFVHCSGDVKNNDFEFYVEPIIGADTELEAGLIYEPNIWQDMFEWRLFKLKDKAKGYIQLGPLTLRPYVDIEAYFSAAASGTVGLEVGKTFSARIGYSQTRGCYIQNTTASGKENKFLKSVKMIDGNLGLKYKCKFDVGCGLYTKNVAIEINPWFEYSLGTEMRLTFEKEEEEKPLQKDIKVFFDINVGADGRMVVDWFGNLKLSPKLEFINTNIAHFEDPLIPTVAKGTFSSKQNGSSVESSFSVTGGLLSCIMDIYPGIAVYEKDKTIKTQLYDTKTQWRDTIPASYAIYGLDDKVSYSVRPIARIFGHDVELDKNEDRWVDLGLPSGILWAAYNVGATSPEEYGGYYAWGETEEKSYYNDVYNEHYNPSKDNYTFIGDDISGTQYDVAHVKWGNGARMPRLSEIEELLNNCSWSINTFNGVSGMTISGPNGKNIFLPFAGHRYNDYINNDGVCGYYWSGKLGYDNNDNDDALCIYFSIDGHKYVREDERACGFPIRAVKDK